MQESMRKDPVILAMVYHVIRGEVEPEKQIPEPECGDGKQYRYDDNYQCNHSSGFYR
jgi:hypothetical protein